jgi:hypothetical protein
MKLEVSVKGPLMKDVGSALEDGNWAEIRSILE